MNEELSNRRRKSCLGAGSQIEIITDAVSLQLRAYWPTAFTRPTTELKMDWECGPATPQLSPINPKTLVSSSVRTLCRNARFSPCLPSRIVTRRSLSRLPVAVSAIKCRRGLHARLDLRTAERTVSAAFPAIMETIYAGYWKSSSRAAINGYHCRRFHRVRPGATSVRIQ
jgi:hypothetical protein